VLKMKKRAGENCLIHVVKWVLMLDHWFQNVRETIEHGFPNSEVGSSKGCFPEKWVPARFHK